MTTLVQRPLTISQLKKKLKSSSGEEAKKIKAQILELKGKTPPEEIPSVVAKTEGDTVRVSKIAPTPEVRVAKTAPPPSEPRPRIGPAVRVAKTTIGEVVELPKLSSPPTSKGPIERKLPKAAPLEIPRKFHKGVISSIHYNPNGSVKYFLVSTANTGSKDDKETISVICHANNFPTGFDQSTLKENTEITFTFGKYTRSNDNRERLCVREFEVLGQATPLVEQTLSTFRRIQSKTSLFSDSEVMAILLTLPGSTKEELMTNLEKHLGKTHLGYVDKFHVFLNKA